MEKKIGFKELSAGFRYALRDVERKDDLLSVLRMVSEYYRLMEAVQQMPYRLRMKYWACTFLIYNFLRVHKQLGRREGKFSAFVRKNTQRIFSTITTDFTD